MTYIENIFICIAAPLFIAVLCMRGTARRMMIFILSGMAMCLICSYISTFIAAVQGADLFIASLEIAPFVEEIVKLFPVLFYILVFEAGKDETADSIVMVAIGFATFENVCYLTQNGSSSLIHLLIRGFGTGAMHVVCGEIIALGFLKLWNREWLRVIGMIALMSVTISYHGIYNILVSQTGAAAVIGYLIPLTSVALMLLNEKISKINLIRLSRL